MPTGDYLMLLNILGSERLVADATPDLVAPFVEFVLRKFIKNARLYKTIVVDVVFTDKIHREDRWGKAEVVDVNSAKPRHFRITLTATGLGFHGIMITLAHELVHIKQWVLGELFFYKRMDRARWHGRQQVMTNCLIEYWERPWEIEARGWEKALVEQYVLVHKLYDLGWLDGTVL